MRTTMTEPTPKRQRGRPRNPDGPTPAKDRLARSKHALLEAGGMRKTINFTPQGALDLGLVMMEHGLQNSTEAVHFALREVAKRYKGPKV